MATPTIHPKAFLSKRKNVIRGLVARTKIAKSLERSAMSVADIARATGLSKRRVAYHLAALRMEKLAVPSKKRPVSWTLTQYGQQALT